MPKNALRQSNSTASQERFFAQQQRHQQQQMPEGLTIWNEEELKNNTRTGDIVFFHGMGQSSKVIELTGPYSHVGMIIRQEGEDIEHTNMLCESVTGQGVRCIELWRLFHDYDANDQTYAGRAFVYRFENHEKMDTRALVHAVMDLSGVHYNQTRLRDIAWRFIECKLSGKSQRPVLAPVCRKQTCNQVICSEFVPEVFARANVVNMTYDDCTGTYTPSALTNTPGLAPHAELGFTRHAVSSNDESCEDTQDAQYAALMQAVDSEEWTEHDIRQALAELNERASTCPPGQSLPSASAQTGMDSALIAGSGGVMAMGVVAPVSAAFILLTFFLGAGFASSGFAFKNVLIRAIVRRVLRISAVFSNAPF